MHFKRTWSLVAAIALAFLGTLGLVAYVHNAHDNAVAGDKLVDVYVASTKIPAGTQADQLASKVRQERVPTKLRASDAVTNLDQLTGRSATVDIVAGEQLLTSRFVTAENQAAQVQSSIPVPAGLFQTTVSLDPDQALGGQIRAGNRVAVVSAITNSTTSGPNATPVTTPATVVARNILVTTVQVDGKAGQGVTDGSQQVAERADRQVPRHARAHAARLGERRGGREQQRRQDLACRGPGREMNGLVVVTPSEEFDARLVGAFERIGAQSPSDLARGPARRAAGRRSSRSSRMRIRRSSRSVPTLKSTTR